MAYNNFIPTIWTTGIERDLERLCVFAEDCNQNYEGKVEELGDSVRIFGVGKPTVYTINRKDASKEINGPEDIQDTSITMPINMFTYFNFKVGDIDKAQALKGLMETLRLESSERMANEIDSYIASFAADKSVKAMFKNPLKVVSGVAGEGEINVLYALEDALEALRKNDVSRNTKVVATVSPTFAKLLRRAYTALDTDNHEELKNGYIGKYNGIIIKESNNVHVTNGSVENIMVRTTRAISYAAPLTKIEPYRPEKMFADALKGGTLYDACVTRPKEIVNLNVTY